MRDMGRDEVQDLLPDLLHGRLPADEAAALERVVAADPDLAAELATLRAVRAAHQSAPAVNIARIVAVLPAPPAAPAAGVVDELAVRRAHTRPMISRSFARAAAFLIVVGGGTMVSVWDRRGTASAPASAPVTAESSDAAGAGMQLGLGTSTDDLSVEQLRALEADIRSLDGVPSAEPEVLPDLMPAEGA